MVNKTFQNYIVNHLNLEKSCDGECTGDHADTCEKCMIIDAHKYLYGSLREKLALSSEVDSSSNDITPFLTGSYRRHTIIRPPKDVDGFVPLNADDYQDYTPKEIIELVYSELLEIYSDYDPQPEISVQSHSVCVQFSDTFGADVIPAFPDGDLYKIPELDGTEDGRWLVSNPKKHIEFVSKVNQDNNGLVVPIAKLLKSWRRDKFESKSIDMKAFHLEMLAVSIFEDHPIKAISSGLLTFFKNAQDYLQGTVADPALKEAGIESNLNDLLDESDKNNLIDLIAEELESAEQAIQLEEENKSVDALDHWKKIFTADGFSETANDTIGKQIASELTRGTTIYRTQDNQRYSFESSDETRSVPKSRSWQNE